jgi:hypothetical protein
MDELEKGMVICMALFTGCTSTGNKADTNTGDKSIENISPECISVDILEECPVVQK